MSGPTHPQQGMSADKRAVLRREIERRRAAATTVRAIQARPPGTPPVLSLAQERLWVLDQMYPGQSTYNATLTLRLQGRLDTAALHRALDSVVARHEALRTVIRRQDDGTPAGSLLSADHGCRWEQIDLADRIDELSGRLHSLAAQPFDLSRDVMLRASLFRLDDDTHVLIMVLHHIASDGWSRSALFDELAEVYNATVAGRTPRLPDLPVQYGDYAAWQRGLAERGHFDRLLDFWRQELSGADLILDLPTDRPRSDVPSFLGSRLSFTDSDLGEQLRLLGRSAAATPFMTYLALTATMLHALTGQTDFLLGCPSANRDRPETAALIGFFVDTIVVRVPLDGNPRFVDVLQRSREAVLRSLSNPVPFDRLVDAVRPKRIAGRNPLFQVNYRMQGAAPPPPALDGIQATRMMTDVGASRFDLAFGFVDAPGPLRGYLEFNAALFSETTIQAWSDTVLTLARAVVADPTTRLDQLVALVQAELAARRATAGPVSSGGPRKIRRTRERNAG